MTDFTMAEITPENEAVYKVFPINLTKMLLHTKSSALPWLKLGLSFRDMYLPDTVVQAVIIRVAALMDCDYEMLQHRSEALRVGNSEDLVNAIIDVSDGSTFDDPAITALMRYVDSAVKDIEADSDALDAVRLYFSDDEVAEITMIAGFYVMNAIYAKSLRLPLDAGTVDWDMAITDVGNA